MVNMNDVAKRAGVSRGTVSNYINNVKIKEKSRIQIEKAIKELGMSYPKEKQVVYYSIENNNYMDQYSDIPKQ